MPPFLKKKLIGSLYSFRKRIVDLLKVIKPYPSWFFLWTFNLQEAEGYGIFLDEEDNAYAQSNINLPEINESTMKHLVNIKHEKERKPDEEAQKKRKREDDSFSEESEEKTHTTPSRAPLKRYFKNCSYFFCLIVRKRGTGVVSLSSLRNRRTVAQVVTDMQRRKQEKVRRQVKKEPWMWGEWLSHPSIVSVISI